MLFSPVMVRAILAGTKFQTRRVEPFTPDEHRSIELLAQHEGRATYKGDTVFTVGPRYVVPGDAIWLRETWHPCDGGTIFCADYPWEDPEDAARAAGVERWYPSIHLRKADARPVRLPVVAHERVERLQAITEEDAIAEGAWPEFEADASFLLAGPRPPPVSTHRLGYKHLWDRINGERGLPWKLNPWVRVVTWTPLPRPKKARRQKALAD